MNLDQILRHAFAPYIILAILLLAGAVTWIVVSSLVWRYPPPLSRRQRAIAYLVSLVGLLCITALVGALLHTASAQQRTERFLSLLPPVLLGTYLALDYRDREKQRRDRQRWEGLGHFTELEAERQRQIFPLASADTDRGLLDHLRYEVRSEMTRIQAELMDSPLSLELERRASVGQQSTLSPQPTKPGLAANHATTLSNQMLNRPHK